MPLNFYLTSRCNESCPFCYADGYLSEGGRRKPAPDTDGILESLRAWADLVRRSGDLPTWEEGMTEADRVLCSAGTVNLLGGEPTIHPDFERIVRAIGELGLGVVVFTNGSLPGKIRAVREHLWTVTVNAHFARRAPELGLPVERVHANLPLQPGMEPVPILEEVRDAGIRTLYFAFATPAGNGPGEAFTPEDQDEMRAVYRAARSFCEEEGIFCGLECSFPVCVDETAGDTRCSSVPVMDPEGYVTICGGEYFLERGKRHVSTFSDVREVHAYTRSLHEGLRALPSRFAICNDCEYFNESCHGMCLAYRDTEAVPAEGLTPGTPRPA